MAALVEQDRTDLIAVIKGVVVESPFGSTQDIIANIVRYAPMSIKHRLFKLLYPNHDTCAHQQPINCIKKVPHNVPILLIYTTTDKTIPSTSTDTVAQWLRDNHASSKVVRLEIGSHANIFSDAYKNIVDGFWAKVADKLAPTPSCA